MKGMEIGDKIKRLRIRNQLTQEELANRCELSKGFISQVERELTSPSITTLLDILECLGTNIKDFFNETIDEKIVFKKDDIFVRENPDLQNQIQWIVPNSQKNRMEPILLNLEPGGITKTDDPHEGEEFGFILAGSVNLHLGNHVFKVRKNESFYFKAIVSHYLSNPGSTKAKVLWVSTPPSF
jgi:transcriptional regulator with XRE-family HTH domain